MSTGQPYQDLFQYIDGEFIGVGNGPSQPVLNPAEGSVLGQLPRGNRDDVARAIAAAERAFRTWRHESPLKRSELLRRAAALMRERAATIGRNITLDQAKPLPAAIRAVTGSLPCRVRFLIEGEEEIGSNHLDAFIANNLDILQADACLWEFGGVDYKGRPQIVERAMIFPPASRLGPLTTEERRAEITAQPLLGKYLEALDRLSAYEVLKEGAAPVTQSPLAAPSTAAPGRPGALPPLRG